MPLDITPEDWHLEDSPECILLCDVQDVVIATIWKQPLDPPEWAEGNARLLRVAPDMLDIIGNLLKAAERWDSDEEMAGSDFIDDVTIVANQARELLATIDS